MSPQTPPSPKPSWAMARGSGKRYIDAMLAAYEPDEEFREKNVESLVRSFNSKMIAKNKDDKLPEFVESARIIEVNRFGAYRIRIIKSSADYRAALAEADKQRELLYKIVESGVRFRPESKFTETQKTEAKKLCEDAKFREDFDVSFDTNAPSTGNPFDEYIPIMGGPFSHQQYLHDFLDGLAKSFEAWNHNPIAHQIVKLTTHFVLGRGVGFKARDQSVQNAFTKWWDEQKMTERLEFWSDTLSLNGELQIRKFFNPVSGELFVRWVDPSTIWEIVTDLEDIERVFYYHQQYPTAYQVLYGAPRGSKFNPSNFGSSKYVINQIPAEEVIHVKANCVPNEKRGRSDLFSILGWLKRYKDFQTAIVLRTIAQSSFAWKNKLQGTQTDVQSFINAFGTTPPQFASMWVENEASTLEPMTTDMGSGKGMPDCPGIINAIAVGSGIPKEYLGLSEHGTRATAVVASEPGVKKFQARQLLLGRVLKDVAQAWVQAEIGAGRLPEMVPGDDDDLPVVINWLKKNGARMPMVGKLIPKVIAAIQALAGINMVPIDTDIEFQFPEIAVEDRTAKMADIESARETGDISHRRSATMRAKELGIEDYDYEKEMDDIADEKAEDAASIYAPVANALGKPAAASPAAPPSGLDKGSGGLSGADRAGIKDQNR